VPSYVRSEIQKKTGIEIDGYGNVITKAQDDNKILQQQNTSIVKNKPQSILKNKESKPITSYKPTGKLIYNNDILDSLQKA
jgi:hypothetical protein